MGTLLIYFLVAALSWGRESLYKKPEAMIEQKKPVAPLKVTKPQSIRPLTGNLDPEIKSNIILEASGSRVILPSAKVKRTHPGLRPGEVLTAVIEESLMAFSESKIPVRAKIVSGPLKNSIFLGEASLEKNSKRITIEFKRFLPSGEDGEYAVLAQAHDSQGLLGVEGRYVTEEQKYFFAEFFSVFASAMADASIHRSQNAWGNYVEEPSTDTITKKAGASALAKSPERWAEKAQAVPGYVFLEGPVVVKVIIHER